MQFDQTPNDVLNELYEDKKHKICESQHKSRSLLLISINNGLYNYMDLISDIEILEDHYNHSTMIKIVINERKYLMRKMLDATFDLEKIIERILKNRFASLNPIINISIE